MKNNYSEKGVSMILIVLIIVIVAVVGNVAMYYYIQKSSSKTTEKSETPTNNIQTTTENIQTTTEQKNVVSSTEDFSRLSPTEIYIKFHEELEKTTNFDELIIVSKKYVSKEGNEKIPENMTDSEKGQYYFLARALIPSLKDINTSSIKENINVNEATLIVQSNNYKSTGTVTYAKEDNIWKMVKESWESEAGFNIVQ